MNFIFIYKSFFLFSILFVLSCNSVEKLADLNFNKKNNIPEIKNSENIENILLTDLNFKSNFTKKFYLKSIKKSKNIQSKLKTVIIDEEFYTFNSKTELFINNSKDGKLIKNYQIIENKKDDDLSTMYFKDNYFILGFRSGKIIKTDLNGDIIWEFKNNKIFNSLIYELNNVVLVLYGDEIVALNFDDGIKLWSEIYEDSPIIQSKGGQIYNFFNDIYFKLPNGRIGSIDLFLGSKKNNKFVNLELQNSINNINDKIYLFKNFVIYLDEGQFLYTYDLLTKDFLLYNYKINSSTSNYFFNNSLITKNDNYLEAINILNGNTFWLIDSKLNKKSKILNIKNINQNLTIFFNNGKIALINDNIISETLDLKVNKINSIDFINNKIITKLENGKIGIF
jgi:outer membrane protein assembly factor BamB